MTTISPAVETVARNDGFVEGVGGLRLHFRTWEVPAAEAALLVVPGLSDHGGRYVRLATHMAELGVSTFALDLRGHGASEGRRGYVRRFSCFLQDLDRFRREVQGLVDPRCPLFLFGHSLGGLIVLRYLQEFEAAVQGAVVSSPWLATVGVPHWKRVAARVLSRVLPALPLPANIDPDGLSHDPQAVRRYRDDPAVHGSVTPRLFVEAERAAATVFDQSDRLYGPLLLLLAGDDRLVDPRRAVELAEAIGDRTDVILNRYPGYYHEVWNEADAGVVLDDVRGWITAHLA
ncbi:MAG: alpha/beta hydrolase [Gemmatimonadota bacterium]